MGLLFGVIAASAYGFDTLFVLCGLLCFISAVASVSLVREPILMIERRLIRVERFVNTLTRASILICHADAYARTGQLKNLSQIFRPNINFFLLGVFTFSFAGNMLFTPLPIYFSSLYSTTITFALFFLNSAANTFGYLLVSRVAKSCKKALILASASRMFLIPLLAFLAVLDKYLGCALAAGILASLGVIWALFEVSSICLFLELSHLGRSGLYSALIGLGSAAGGLLGGYTSMFYGFKSLFMVCSLMYSATLLTFALQFKKMACE